MPSKVILVKDPAAHPYELGFEPTEEPAGGFEPLVAELTRQVREVCPSGSVVVSASGDPGARPILKHMTPSLEGPGADMLYVRADSQSPEDILAAATDLQGFAVARAKAAAEQA